MMDVQSDLGRNITEDVVASGREEKFWSLDEMTFWRSMLFVSLRQYDMLASFYLAKKKQCDLSVFFDASQPLVNTILGKARKTLLTAHSLRKLFLSLPVDIRDMMLAALVFYDENVALKGWMGAVASWEPKSREEDMWKSDFDTAFFLLFGENKRKKSASRGDHVSDWILAPNSVCEQRRGELHHAALPFMLVSRLDVSAKNKDAVASSFIHLTDCVLKETGLRIWMTKANKLLWVSRDMKDGSVQWRALRPSECLTKTEYFDIKHGLGRKVPASTTVNQYESLRDQVGRRFTVNGLDCGVVAAFKNDIIRQKCMLIADPIQNSILFNYPDEIRQPTSNEFNLVWRAESEDEDESVKNIIFS